MPVVLEDAVFWPEKLSSHAVPRRGGVAVPVKKLKPQDRALIFERRDGPVREILYRPAGEGPRERRSDEALVAAGRAHLDGDPAPLGAAVVGALTASVLMWSEAGKLPALAESWLESGGPVFAARAVAELAGVEVLQPHSGPGPTIRRAGQPRPMWASTGTSWHWLAWWVRVRLVEAPEKTIAEVVAALSAYRKGPLMQRVLTSYLAPDRTAWVDEDCALLATAGDAQATRLLAASVTRADQLATVAAAGAYEPDFFERTVATLLDGVGAAVGPQLGAWLDQPRQPVGTKRLLLSVLSGLPTDEALGALVKRRADKVARPFLVTATGRYPARALRLLAATGGDGELLRQHVLGHQQLAERLLPDLPDDDAKRVRRVLDEVASRAPVAPAEPV